MNYTLHTFRAVSRVAIALVLFTAISAPATSHYVDSSIVTSGNGSSWSTAWKNFSNITWASVAAGDTIYISGGSTSKTYLQTLSVGASGTSTARITITKGLESGHNGTVIIDGQSTRLVGVYMNARNYITIRGLTVKNHIGDDADSQRGQIEVAYCTGNIIENNTLFIAGHGGVWLSDNTNITVRGNSMDTVTFSTRQTDGIYSQRNTGNIYENNTIVISNSETNGHIDCIQSYTDTTLTIRGNYCNQNHNKGPGADGNIHVGNIYAEKISGAFKVYNNTVNSPNAPNALITIQNLTTNNGVLYAYNNTLRGGGQWGHIFIGNAPNSVVKNNIIISSTAGATGIRIAGTRPAVANINYNIYNCPNAALVQASDYVSNTVNYTFTQWKALGYEVNGKNVNPLVVDLTNKNFHLQSTSPAINAGVTISEVATDKDGVARPQGTAYDIGAYEYVSASPLQTINNDSALITYGGGTWTEYGSSPGSYNSDYKYTNTSASFAQYSFVGTQVQLIVLKSPTYGMAGIYIDGVLKTTVDYYSATTQYQQMIYSISGLTNASHTIKVLRTGTKNESSTGYGITIDAFKSP